MGNNRDGGVEETGWRGLDMVSQANRQQTSVRRSVMNSAVEPDTTTWALATTFSWVQLRRLLALREEYRQDRDLFCARERAHLRFLRWLYLTGRLAP